MKIQRATCADARVEHCLKRELQMSKRKIISAGVPKPAKITTRRGCPSVFYPLATNHCPLTRPKLLQTRSYRVTYFVSRGCQNNRRNSMILKNRVGDPGRARPPLLCRSKIFSKLKIPTRGWSVISTVLQPSRCLRVLSRDTN